MVNVFSVKDYISKCDSDSQVIENCFKDLNKYNEKTIIFDGKDWFIDRAILVPSNTTIIVDGVKIKQLDYTFDNVFRADNFVVNNNAPYGYPLSIREAKNIKIIGKNGAIIEGPDKNKKAFHPTLNEEQEMVGDYWGWRGFQILISNVDGYEICGFKFLKQRSWAISMDRSKNGYLHDLEFISTVKNGDGINARAGCSYITIENIKGETTDDLIALNSGTDVNAVYPVGKYVYPLVPSNCIKQNEPVEDRFLHDVRVNNVYTKGVSGVALLSRNGNKLFNVEISNVYDLHTKPFIHPLYGNSNLKLVSSYKGYDQEHFTVGDYYNVNIFNVQSKYFAYAVDLGDEFKNVKISNVTQEYDKGVLLNFVESQDLSEIEITNCKKV